MNWVCRPVQLGFLTLIIFSGVAVPLRAQVIIHVNPEHEADPGPGDPNLSNPEENGSEDAPFDAIQEAIDVAEDGDTVLLADGIYTGVGNRDIVFDGKAIVVKSDNSPENCIVDCQSLGRGFFFHQGETGDSVLEGITIRNGLANIFGEQFGGGIRCDSSSPTIRNCVITQNRAEGRFVVGGLGGGIACLSSHPTIDRCRIVSNSAIGNFSQGCGLYLKASSPLIVDTVIEGNSGSFGDLSAGGGLFCTNSSHPTLLRTSLIANKSSFAGAMACQSASNPKLVDCVIKNNIAQSTPGVHLVGSSSPTFRNCLITGNTGSFEGGGIDAFSGTSPILSNCTITNNSVSGIGCLGGDPIIENCIIADNDDDLIQCVSAYSCIGDGDAGTGNIAGDPIFVSESDFRLDATSPCINAGDPNFSIATQANDLDGHQRVLCGRVDIGAYEFGIGDFDCDATVDLFDFFEWADCMTGPIGGPVEGACLAFDFDADFDVDLADANAFWQIIQATIP